jgi:hypothetical protein
MTVERYTNSSLGTLYAANVDDEIICVKYVVMRLS